MIKAPSWCKDAVPSTKGWHHPRTCELLKSQSFTQEQVDEWHGPKKKPAKSKPVVEPVEDAPYIFEVRDPEE
jgi:hypothetical protein